MQKFISNHRYFPVWIGAIILVCLLVAYCSPINSKKVDSEATLILDWYKHALDAERYTEGYRGPIAARMYGFVGLAAYEAALPMNREGYLSLGEQFPDIQFPDAGTAKNLYLPAVLNGCYAKMMDLFFPTAPDHIKQSRMLLKQRWKEAYSEEVNDFTLQSSLRYGEQVAQAVFDWSAKDPIGHRANFHLYDRNYKPPVGEDKWVPCRDFPVPALLPYWGKVKPFVIQPDEFLAKPYTDFSTDVNSDFYNQALEIYSLNTPLSNENLWISEFWSDDQAGHTFSPTGRWVSITNQVIEKEIPSTGKMLETYLMVGFALNDASVAAWKSKYHYNLMRPETYINQYFDPEWHPVHHTPPFPSYPSGHAVFGAAAAEVLAGLYGENFQMEDRSHADRTDFKGMPRSFDSFYEMAFESAFSRIPMGVHFRMDCEEGLRLGLLIGKKVGTLKLKTPGDFTLRQ